MFNLDILDDLKEVVIDNYISNKNNELIKSHYKRIISQVQCSLISKNLYKDSKLKITSKTMNDVNSTCVIKFRDYLLIIHLFKITIETEYAPSELIKVLATLSGYLPFITINDSFNINNDKLKEIFYKEYFICLTIAINSKQTKQTKIQSLEKILVNCITSFNIDELIINPKQNLQIINALIQKNFIFPLRLANEIYKSLKLNIDKVNEQISVKENYYFINYQLISKCYEIIDEENMDFYIKIGNIVINDINNMLSLIDDLFIDSNNDKIKLFQSAFISCFTLNNMLIFKKEGLKEKMNEENIEIKSSSLRIENFQKLLGLLNKKLDIVKNLFNEESNKDKLESIIKFKVILINQLVERFIDTNINLDSNFLDYYVFLYELFVINSKENNTLTLKNNNDKDNIEDEYNDVIQMILKCYKNLFFKEIELAKDKMFFDEFDINHQTNINLESQTLEGNNNLLYITDYNNRFYNNKKLLKFILKDTSLEMKINYDINGNIQIDHNKIMYSTHINIFMEYILIKFNEKSNTYIASSILSTFLNSIPKELLKFKIAFLNKMSYSYLSFLYENHELIQSIINSLKNNLDSLEILDYYLKFINVLFENSSFLASPSYKILDLIESLTTSTMINPFIIFKFVSNLLKKFLILLQDKERSNFLNITSEENKGKLSLIVGLMRIIFSYMKSLNITLSQIVEFNCKENKEIISILSDIKLDWFNILTIISILKIFNPQLEFIDDVDKLIKCSVKITYDNVDKKESSSKDIWKSNKFISPFIDLSLKEEFGMYFFLIYLNSPCLLFNKNSSFNKDVSFDINIDTLKLLDEFKPIRSELFKNISSDLKERIKEYNINEQMYCFFLYYSMLTKVISLNYFLHGYNFLNINVIVDNSKTKNVLKKKITKSLKSWTTKQFNNIKKVFNFKTKEKQNSDDIIKEESKILDEENFEKLKKEDYSKNREDIFKYLISNLNENSSIIKMIVYYTDNTISNSNNFFIIYEELFSHFTNIYLDLIRKIPNTQFKQLLLKNDIKFLLNGACSYDLKTRLICYTLIKTYSEIFPFLLNEYDVYEYYSVILGIIASSLMTEYNFFIRGIVIENLSQNMLIQNNFKMLEIKTGRSLISIALFTNNIDYNLFEKNKNGISDLNNIIELSPEEKNRQESYNLLLKVFERSIQKSHIINSNNISFNMANFVSKCSLNTVSINNEAKKYSLNLLQKVYNNIKKIEISSVLKTTAYLEPDEFEKYLKENLYGNFDKYLPISAISDLHNFTDYSQSSILQLRNKYTGIIEGKINSLFQTCKQDYFFKQLKHVCFDLESDNEARIFNYIYYRLLNDYYLNINDFLLKISENLYENKSNIKNQKHNNIDSISILEKLSSFNNDVNKIMQYKEKQKLKYQKVNKVSSKTSNLNVIKHLNENNNLNNRIENAPEINENKELILIKGKSGWNYKSRKNDGFSNYGFNNKQKTFDYKHSIDNSNTELSIFSLLIEMSSFLIYSNENFFQTTFNKSIIIDELTAIIVSVPIFLFSTKSLDCGIFCWEWILYSGSHFLIESLLNNLLYYLKSYREFARNNYYMMNYKQKAIELESTFKTKQDTRIVKSKVTYNKIKHSFLSIFMNKTFKDLNKDCLSKQINLDENKDINNDFKTNNLIYNSEEHFNTDKILFGSVKQLSSEKFNKNSNNLFKSKKFENEKNDIEESESIFHLDLVNILEEHFNASPDIDDFISAEIRLLKFIKECMTEICKSDIKKIKYILDLILLLLDNTIDNKIFENPTYIYRHFLTLNLSFELLKIVEGKSKLLSLKYEDIYKLRIKTYKYGFKYFEYNKVRRMILHKVLLSEIERYLIYAVEVINKDDSDLTPYDMGNSNVVNNLEFSSIYNISCSCNNKPYLSSFKSIKSLLIYLIESEILNLRYWNTPFIKHKFTFSKITNQEEIFISSFDVNINLPIKLVQRFPWIEKKYPRYMKLLLQLIEKFWKEVKEIPEALNYYICKINPNKLKKNYLIKELFLWKSSHIHKGLNYLSLQYNDNYNLHKIAIRLLNRASKKSIIFYLPQLLQSLRTKTNHEIEKFLLEKCNESTMIAHQLIWLLQVEQKSKFIL